jgi:hypothetical protein
MKGVDSVKSHLHVLFCSPAFLSDVIWTRIIMSQIYDNKKLFCILLQGL